MAVLTAHRLLGQLNQIVMLVQKGPNNKILLKLRRFLSCMKLAVDLPEFLFIRKIFGDNHSQLPGSVNFSEGLRQYDGIASLFRG
jgi:hypothetical protein